MSELIRAGQLTPLASGVSAPQQMTPSGCPKLTEALALARDRCEAAAKDRTNSHHGYSYASADRVIAVAGEALRTSGLALIPLRQELVVKGTAQVSWYVLDRDWVLSHASGEYVPLSLGGWPVLPERGRPLDKAFAIALTASLAYLLRDLLQMPRGTDDDVAAQDDRQTPVQQQPQQQPQKEQATISPEQEAALMALCREKGRTPDEARALCASLGVPALAAIPARHHDLAARLLSEGQVSTAQLDRLSELLRLRRLDPRRVDERLMQKYGAPRLRLLTAAQAEDLEKALSELPRTQGTPPPPQQAEGGAP